jgi:hypothetical protein
VIDFAASFIGMPFGSASMNASPVSIRWLAVHASSPEFLQPAIVVLSIKAFAASRCTFSHRAMPACARKKCRSYRGDHSTGFFDSSVAGMRHRLGAAGGSGKSGRLRRSACCYAGC